MADFVLFRKVLEDLKVIKKSKGWKFDLLWCRSLLLFVSKLVLISTSTFIYQDTSTLFGLRVKLLPATPAV